jgi:hypothetical protein
VSLVLNRLLAAGALDVTLTPMQMKKNRPATQLAVLCRPNDVDTLLPIILTETTTLGVRRSAIERVSLPRSIETVETRYGSIRVKVARWQDIDRAVPVRVQARSGRRRRGDRRDAGARSMVRWPMFRFLISISTRRCSRATGDGRLASDQPI